MDWLRHAKTDPGEDVDGKTSPANFRRHGIRRIRQVLSDNGACYRSRAFSLALARSRSRHKRTRPYRPQTNGKVERYQRSWTATNIDPRTALGGKPPITRCPRVSNLAA